MSRDRISRLKTVRAAGIRVNTCGAPDLDEVAEWQRVSGNLVGKIRCRRITTGCENFIRALADNASW